MRVQGLGYIGRGKVELVVVSVESVERAAPCVVTVVMV